MIVNIGAAGIKAYSGKRATSETTPK